MRFLLVLFLWIFSLASCAQEVPGYLGKRWTIQYEGHLFPSFYNPNKEAVEYKYFSDGTRADVDIKTSVNYQHHLSSHYVVSKRNTIGIDLAYLSTYANIAYGNQLQYDLSSFNYDKHLHISAFSAALSWKIFSDHLAPLGKHWELKAGMIHYTTGDLSYAFVENGAYNRAHIPGTGGTTLFLGAAYGIQRVIRDKFIIGGGIDLNFVIGDLGYRQGVLSAETPYSLTEESNDLQTKQDIIKGYAESRLFAHYLVNFKIGVGILL